MEMSEEQKLKFVPYSHRYTAAWAEINQRVTARQSVYVQFATVSVTAIVAVLGAWAKSREQSSAAWAGWIADGGAIGLVIYSWAFAFWIRNNHAVVGLLGVYCKALEGGFDPDAKPNPDYAWHTDDQGWIVVARRYGRYSDLAAISLAILASAPAGLFSLYHFKVCELWLGIVLLTFSMAGIGAAGFFFWNRKVRDQIAKLTPEQVKEKGRKWRPRN